MDSSQFHTSASPDSSEEITESLKGTSSHAADLSDLSSDVASKVEDLIERFEAAWDSTKRPDIVGYLADLPSARDFVLRELVQTDLEYRLKHHEPARIEDYLSRFPELARDEEFCISFLVQEFDLRRRIEKGLGCDEFVRRFPDWTAKVAEALQSDSRSNRAIQSRLSLRLDCPHCHNGIEIVTGSTDDAVFCPSCGSTLQLNSEQSHSWRRLPFPLIPKFQLIEAVGRGSFGTVYKAFDDQLQRIVAVKIPRSGSFGTVDDEDRFAREARSVAQLSHPGIVAVHSVGRSEDFPYLVSEFVDGVTLSQRLLERPITVLDSVTLIRDISLALQHAHARGVVHRDLKPSNIMLTADGQPRIMDFGLAKRNGTEITMTLDGHILGTPAYMSPEQAEGNSRCADERCDIYSLGVILFELLTGRRPFQGDTTMLIYQIRNVAPPQPIKLKPQIPQNLDTICIKCLAKDPNERYQSAQELADELQRYLDGKPIRARPVGTAEHLWRWCSRNPVVAGLASAALTLLLAIAIVSTAAYIRESKLVKDKDRLLVEKQSLIDAKDESVRRETEASKRATDARLTAERKSEEANQTVRFLQQLFLTSDPVGFGGAGFRVDARWGFDLTARQLVAIGAEKVKSNEELKRQPLILASLLDTLGSVQTSLGLYDEAEPQLSEALAIREKLLESDHEDLAISYLNLGTLHQYHGRFDEAESLCRKALEIQRRKLHKADLRIATTEVVLGWMISHRFGDNPSAERLREAMDLFADAVLIRRNSLGALHRDVGIALVGLGAVQLAHPETKVQGFGSLNSAFAILDSKDSFASLLVEYMFSVNDRNSGNFEEAIRRRRLIIEKTSKTLGEQHPLNLMLLGDLAGTLRAKGDFEEAERTIRRVFELARPTPSRWHPAYAEAHIELGIRVRDRGDSEDARRLLDEALVVSEKIKNQSLIDRTRWELLLVK